MTKQGTIILPQTDLNSPLLCSYTATTNYAGYDQTDGMTTEEGVFSLAIARPATIATIARPATNANDCLSHRNKRTHFATWRPKPRRHLACFIGESNVLGQVLPL